MAKDPNGTDPNTLSDARPVYESPQVLRLGDLHRGTGGCQEGSSALVNCSDTGIGAVEACSSNGSSAITSCSAGDSPGQGG